MKKLWYNLIVFLCSLSFSGVHAVSAQENGIQNGDSSSNFKRQYLLIGGGFQISDANLMQPTFSTRFGYGYSFLPKWNVEAAFSFSGESSIYRMRMIGVGSAMSVQSGRCNTGDVLAYFTTPESWKVGGGMQIRQTIYSSIWSQYPFNTDAQVDHLFEFRIGAQAMLEYAFYLGKINLAIRGAFAYFLPPFAGDAFIGTENFVNFPATPQAKMTVAPFLSPREYFNQLLPLFPFTVSIGVVVCIDF